MRPPEHPEITAMRRQAKAIQKATGLKHCNALDEIAKTKGYNNWARLIEDKKYKS